MPRELQREGVSYRDVYEYLQDAQKHYHCHCHFEWWPTEVRGKGLVWSLRLVARWKGVGAAVVRERGWSRDWPHPDYKTPPCAMLRLVWDMEDELYKAETAIAQASEGQLSFG